MQLVAVDRAPVDLGVQEPADDVVAEVARSLAAIELGAEPILAVGERGVARLVGRRVERVLGDDDVLERHEVLALRSGDPHDRQEDRRRERITPLDVGIGLAAVDEPVDQLVRSCADARLERRQLLRREHRVEELAPLRVLGAVQLERDRDVVPAEPEARTVAAAREDVGHRAATELSHRVGTGERLDVAHLAQRDQAGRELLDALEELPLVELLGVVAHEERGVVGDRVETARCGR